MDRVSRSGAWLMFTDLTTLRSRHVRTLQDETRPEEWRNSLLMKVRMCRDLLALHLHLSMSRHAYTGGPTS